MRTAILTLLLVVGILMAGCATAQGNLLGNAPLIDAKHVSVKQAQSTFDKPVTLQGVMVDKCPTAACWFHLKDDSGITKVNLANTGFTVTDVPVGSTVTVSGKMMKTGDETKLDASGMRW